MKSRKELEKIAREIVDVWSGKNKRVSCILLQEEITEALARMQDEAVNGVLPSIVEYKVSGKPHEIVRGVYDYLRANMKPAPLITKSVENVINQKLNNTAPQMPSDGDIQRAALSHADNEAEYTDIRVGKYDGFWAGVKWLRQQIDGNREAKSTLEDNELNDGRAERAVIDNMHGEF